jgi:hypothetical protein
VHSKILRAWCLYSCGEGHVTCPWMLGVHMHALWTETCQLHAGYSSIRTAICQAWHMAGKVRSP